MGYYKHHNLLELEKKKVDTDCLRMTRILKHQSMNNQIFKDNPPFRYRVT